MHKPTLLLISLTMLAAAASAQDVPRTNKTQEAAAAQGLALMRALAGDKASDLGFKSSNDAARATLGAPLQGLFVHRLTEEARAEVREAMADHLDRMSEPDGDGVAVTTEVAVVTAHKPG